MTETTRVGEIIEASTAEFTAQCYELYQSPPLGSLVRIGNSSEASYGIIYHATTTSLEPGRRPIARGKDEASEEAIYQSSPQLAKLLRSEFSALVVGYRDGDTLRHYLPPQPARIHSFVYQCPSEEIKEFSQSMAFLNILLSHPLPLPTEEIIAACLRRISQVHEDPHAFLVATGRDLAILLGGEFKQLKFILDKVRL